MSIDEESSRQDAVQVADDDHPDHDPASPRPDLAHFDISDAGEADSGDLSAAPLAKPGDMPNAPPTYSIWIGPAGLRAGWSLALYAIFLVILGAGAGGGAFLVVVAVRYVNPAAARGFATGGPQTWYLTLFGEGICVAVVLGATLIMGLIEKRRFSEFGLGGAPRRWKNLAMGALWGFVCFALLIALLVAFHGIQFDSRMLSPARIAPLGVAWLLAFTGVGAFEELLFRGYLQYTLSRGLGHQAWGFWISALLFSFGFGAIHSSNPGESPIGLVSAGLIGVVFCLSLWYTRSLWWAIGFHAIWDWAQSFVFGTADSGMMIQGHLLSARPIGHVLLSGGATGPEGSVFVVLVCLLAGVLIFLTLKKEISSPETQALLHYRPPAAPSGVIGTADLEPA